MPPGRFCTLVYGYLSDGASPEGRAALDDQLELAASPAKRQQRMLEQVALAGGDIG